VRIKGPEASKINRPKIPVYPKDSSSAKWHMFKCKFDGYKLCEACEAQVFALMLNICEDYLERLKEGG
jgi:hypothetical protein